MRIILLNGRISISRCGTRDGFCGSFLIIFFFELKFLLFVFYVSYALVFLKLPDIFFYRNSTWIDFSLIIRECLSVRCTNDSRRGFDDSGDSSRYFEY